MKTVSPIIDIAVEIACRGGNSVREVSQGWSKAQMVVHMRRILESPVRAEIEATCPSLRYWRSERSPHNSPEEGFICDEHRVGLSFPIP